MRLASVTIKAEAFGFVALRAKRYRGWAGLKCEARIKKAAAIAGGGLS